MKHSRQESKLMDKAILELFKARPEAKLVENRYQTLRKLIKDRYYWLGYVERERMYQIIFDIVSLDRKVRLFTQSEQKALKKRLSEQYIVDNII